MRKIALLALLGLFTACDQGLNVSEKNDAPGIADRKPAGAENSDGDYTFYFKNGKSISGDCDGYTLRLNGKTEIFEYYQAGIKAWEKKLKGAGIPVEVTRTSKFWQYCVIRFDTSLLKGIGETDITGSADSTIYKNGKSVKLESKGIRYMPDGNIQIWLYRDADLLKSIGIDVLSRVQDPDTTYNVTTIDPEGVFFYQSRCFILSAYW